MHTPNSYNEIIQIIAASAEICIKPWRFSVVRIDEESSELINNIDLILRLECRNSDGKRKIENDIEMEIYKSGGDVNLILYWVKTKDDFILWQGVHPIWMDSRTGKRLNPPKDSLVLESLARRIRAIFKPNESNYG